MRQFGLVNNTVPDSSPDKGHILVELTKNYLTDCGPKEKQEVSME